MTLSEAKKILEILNSKMSFSREIDVNQELIKEFNTNFPQFKWKLRDWDVELENENDFNDLTVEE